MKLCPEAKVDDGFLDVTYVQNVEPEKIPELMQVVLTGKKEDELSESIKTMRVTWLEVLHIALLHELICFWVAASTYEACLQVVLLHSIVMKAILHVLL